MSVAAVTPSLKSSTILEVLTAALVPDGEASVAVGGIASTVTAMFFTVLSLSLKDTMISAAPFATALTVTVSPFVETVSLSTVAMLVLLDAIVAEVAALLSTPRPIVNVPDLPGPRIRLALLTFGIKVNPSS